MSGFGAFSFGNSPFGTTWTNPNAPNLTDFTAYVYDVMQVPVAALPIGNPWIGYAFNRAMSLVFFAPQVDALEYVLAVYNCAAHILILATPDQPKQTTFETLRKKWKLLEVEIGVIQSSSDQGTGQAFAIGNSMRNMSIGDLSFYKSPYGRAYLCYASDAGPNVWGLS